MPDDFEPTPISDLLNPNPEITDDDLALLGEVADAAGLAFEEALQSDALNGQATSDRLGRVQRWRIDGTGSAAWAMAKAREAHDERAANTMLADDLRAPLLAELERIDEWEKRVNREPTRLIAFFEGHLTRWALDERERTGQATLRLPGGTVPTKYSAARFEIGDMAAAVAYAKSLGIAPKETVGVSELSGKVRPTTLVAWTVDERGNRSYIANGEARWVPNPDHDPDDLEDENDGQWIVTDRDSGLVIDDAVVEHGLFVVGQDGAPVEGLTAIGEKVTAPSVKYSTA